MAEITDLTLDLVTKWLNENEDGKKYLKSYADTHVTKGVKTFEDNFLKEKFPKLLEDEITKRYPAETPEQKRLKELELKFAQTENEKRRAVIQNKLLKIANEKKIPDFFVDYAVDEDEEKSTEKLEKLGQNFTTILNREVESRLAGGGRKIPLPNDNSGKPVDINNLPDNDPEFYKKNADTLNKLLGQT